MLGAAHDDYSGGAPREKLQQANQRCLLMLQIETEVGLENVEQIAAVPGVDCLSIGFMDLSNFLGVPGELTHSIYLAAVERIVLAAKKHRRVLSILAPTEALAKEYVARGFQLIFFGSDVALLQSALAQRIQAVRT